VPCGKDTDQQLLDTVADETSEAPDEILLSEEIRGNLNQWLDQLPAKQCEVIARRYGVRGHHVSTLEQVASEMGVTRERVRQVQMGALKSLRVILENEGYSPAALLN
jgi:RNA polymerase nonessential primary-like sigma factor